MRHGIALQNDQPLPVDEARLTLAARIMLDSHATRAAGLTIVIQDAAAVAALNQQHRGINAPTDVLSFPAPALPDAIDDKGYLGDIVIALDYAAAQAQASGAAVGDALCLLVAHGVLHLLGYDHDTNSAREAMWQAQAEGLRRLGIDPDLPSRYGGGDA